MHEHSLRSIFYAAAFGVTLPQIITRDLRMGNFVTTHYSKVRV
jgi:hypothetical protein